MRRSLLATLAAALIGMAATTAPTHASGFTACPGSYQPDGTPGGGFYGKIKAKGVGCTEARKVTQTWVKRMASGAKPPTSPITVLGYACKGKAVGGALDVQCTKGAKVVRFHGQP